MLPDYRDITCRIVQPPSWYDHHGVPRYDPFKPTMLGVYDKYAIFAEIECQSCCKKFRVGCGWPGENMQLVLATPDDQQPEDPDWWKYSLEKLTEGFHYGDPPSHSCTGDSMNCIDLRIIEAWEKDGYGWMRRLELEGDIS